MGPIGTLGSGRILISNFANEHQHSEQSKSAKGQGNYQMSTSSDFINDGQKQNSESYAAFVRIVMLAGNINDEAQQFFKNGERADDMDRSLR